MDSSSFQTCATPAGEGGFVVPIPSKELKEVGKIIVASSSLDSVVKSKRRTAFALAAKERAERKRREKEEEEEIKKKNQQRESMYGDGSGVGSRGGRDDPLVLLVALMDGHVVAVRFDVPRETPGRVLPESVRRKIFRSRYGVDLDGDDDGAPRRRLVDDRSGPKLIENAL